MYINFILNIVSFRVYFQKVTKDQNNKKQYFYI